MFLEVLEDDEKLQRRKSERGVGNATRGATHGGQAVEECRGELAKSGEELQGHHSVCCDGFHQRIPSNFSNEMRGEVVKFFEKVEKWSSGWAAPYGINSQLESQKTELHHAKQCGYQAHAAVDTGLEGEGLGLVGVVTALLSSQNGKQEKDFFF